MIDYGNMPVLIWTGAISAKKATAQIHHEEPLILQMPNDFIVSIDAPVYGCRAGKKSGNHIDCDAESLLQDLATENNMPELATLAKAAHDAGQVVDVDTETRRIIFHD